MEDMGMDMGIHCLRKVQLRLYRALFRDLLASCSLRAVARQAPRELSKRTSTNQRLLQSSFRSSWRQTRARITTPTMNANSTGGQQEQVNGTGCSAAKRRRIQRDEYVPVPEFAQPQQPNECLWYARGGTRFLDR
ncbi:hypothetical protein ACEPAI_3300 [Sanghuangporus weigelae]